MSATFLVEQDGNLTDIALESLMFAVIFATVLDSLLNLQLSGALSQDEYVAKKTKLLNQKINISEKIAAQENPEGIRDFLKKIGSNFHIAERTLACELKKPWRVARKWYVVSLRDTPTLVHSGESENWRRIVEDVRTYWQTETERFFIPKLSLSSAVIV